MNYWWMFMNWTNECSWTVYSNVVFRKEVISHSNIYKFFGPESLIRRLKARKFVQKKWFFLFHYSRTTWMTNWVQIFTDLLFYAYVGIHKVRVLVFDNYQRCPVPLNTYSNCLLFITCLLVKHQSVFLYIYL